MRQISIIKALLLSHQKKEAQTREPTPSKRMLLRKERARLKSTSPNI